MSLLHQFKYALTLSFPAAAVKGLRLGWRTLAGNCKQLRRNSWCTYEEVKLSSASLPYSYVAKIPQTLLAPLTTSLGRVSDNYLNHRFDLLGSGWLKVEYGMRCAGFAGHNYTRNIDPPDVFDIDRLINMLSPGNRCRARRIRQLIDPEYQPIDWQIDFKSGYRWRESQCSQTIRYGHEPGVDIKVPWELARLQHLPQLAWAYILATNGAGSFKAADTYSNEFRNQVLDFIAANPPDFGVNWSCTMDVAIRAANLVLGMDIFTRHGVTFDDEFNQEFTASILAHGRFIAANLEWNASLRANHYLADIAGLLFVSAYLERSPETDCWLAFAVHQLILEVDNQFTNDGANFEGSTSYHRLSAEMVAYCTALIIGLGDDKKKALTSYDCRLWRSHPSLPSAPISIYPLAGNKNSLSPFPEWYFKRLERMAEFMMHITKPNRMVVQIGDNDSGRFFKLFPVYTGTLDENHLDHRPTIAAINGLFSRNDLASFAGAKLESAMTLGMAAWNKTGSYLQEGGNIKAVGRTVMAKNKVNPAFVQREITIDLGGTGILDGLETLAYPDFGLYIWRSPRFFLSLRCGSIGQNGNGGHSHNDQLAIEINIDGDDWLADPGSYVYTPSAIKRDAYRSVLAHSAPHAGKAEPARLNLGMFCLEDSCKAQCLRFNKGTFHGIHYGFDVPVHRVVIVNNQRIVIGDSATKDDGNSERYLVKDAESLRKLFIQQVAFSPGYGGND